MEYQWVCIVCEMPVNIVTAGNDSVGILPCVEGGTLQIDCGWGSKFDSIERGEGQMQGCICDKCLTKKKKFVRLVEIENYTRIIVKKTELD